MYIHDKGIRIQSRQDEQQIVTAHHIEIERNNRVFGKASSTLPAQYRRKGQVKLAVSWRSASCRRRPEI